MPTINRLLKFVFKSLLGFYEGRITGIGALFRPVRDEMVLRTFDFYPDLVPTAQLYTEI